MSNTLYNHVHTSSVINNTSVDLSNNPTTNQISELIQSMNAYHQNIELYNRNISDLLNIIRITNTSTQTYIPRSNARTQNSYRFGNGVRNARTREQSPNTNNRRTHDLGTRWGVRLFSGDGLSSQNNISHPLTQLEIDQYITTITYEDGMNDTVCPISLDDFVVGESICKINVCGHIFKQNQLLQWVSSRNQCPVCRAHIVSREHRDRVDTSGNNPDISGNYTDTSRNTILSLLTFNEILSLFDSNTHPSEYMFDIPFYYDSSSNISFARYY